MTSYGTGFVAVTFLALLLHLCTCAVADDVSGPVVKLSDVHVSGTNQPETASAVVEQEKQQGGLVEIAAAVQETAKGVAREVDKTLIKEFGNGTIEVEGKTFAAALSNINADGTAKEEGKLETVVRISGSSSSSVAETESNTTTDADEVEEPVSEAIDTSIEKSVDRIIDQHDNEFVLSKPGSADAAALTLDPQLITDLTVVLVSAAVLGVAFEALGQPTITGYLVAGAIVGPGCLQWVKELVQVESIAQIGVYLLLFALGMELNLTKVRSVIGVSVVGGSLQIILAMAIGGAVSAWMCDSPFTPGVFTGALLAMSSTSVVVKCLEATRSMSSSYGTIVVGTLIMQDCWVGLLFALMPIFKPQSPSPSAVAGVPPPPAPAGEAAVAMALQAAIEVAAADDKHTAERTAAVLVAVFSVLFRIVVLGGASILLARLVLSRLLQLLVRHASTELNQMVMVGFCLACTWAGGRAGISDELGAFLGGIMVSAAASTAVMLPGPLLRFKGEHALGHSGAAAGVAGGGHAAAKFSSPEKGRDMQSLSGGGVIDPVHPSRMNASDRARAVEELQHGLRQNIDSVHNILTALFLASMALIISPRFLMQHVRVLAIGTVLVMGLKTVLVAGTVSYFGYPWRTSLAVGLTMAHVGEFSFVLLSTSAQLDILPIQVYQLLLGITALSLLATPLVIILCSRLLREATLPSGAGGGGGMGGDGHAHMTLKMGLPGFGEERRKPYRFS